VVGEHVLLQVVRPREALVALHIIQLIEVFQVYYFKKCIILYPMNWLAEGKNPYY
jgi:hypothetical protein